MVVVIGITSLRSEGGKADGNLRLKGGSLEHAMVM